MRGVTGQATFTLDGLADALEQLILGFQQRLQFAGKRLQLQWLKGIGIAPHQRLAQTIEWCKTLTDAQPQQAQAAQQGHTDRHRSGEQNRHVQGFALDLPIRRSDAHIAPGQGETAPRCAVDHLIVEAHFLGFQRLLGVVVASRENLAAQ